MFGIGRFGRRTKRKYTIRVNLPTKKPKDDPTPTKITEVNVDCLEKIFEHLNLTDLNNVAEAHPHFVSAARLVYKRKHAMKTVKIYESSHMLSVYNDSSDPEYIVDATATTFLSNFGHLVQKLRLDYSPSPFGYSGSIRHHWRNTEQAIFEHCTKTLREIELINIRGNVMEEIRKPFEKVTSVYIYDIFGDTVQVKLSKWFPNTRKLELNCSAVTITTYARDDFHHLDELRLVVLNQFYNYRKDETNIRNFLRSHQRITSLSIDSKFTNWLKCDFDFMLFINQTLPRLEKLRWVHMKLNVVGEVKKIHFKYVKSFELQTTGQFPKNVFITFRQLKSLKMYGLCDGDRNWLNFITQNKHLVKLGYFPNMHYHKQTANDLLEITTKLPQLNAIYLQAHTISPQNLKRFLMDTTSTKLMKIRLKFFAGFKKGDLDEYLDAIDGRHFNTVLESNSTCDGILLQRTVKASF